MANLFNQNPIILDTAWTAGTIPAALSAITSPQQFSLIKWVNPITAGDECKITDAAAAGPFVLFDQFCAVAHQDVVLWDASVGGKKYTLKQGLWVLATLTSGKVYLWR